MTWVNENFFNILVCASSQHKYYMTKAVPVMKVTCCS